ncbi:MAG: thiazole tautomerase TenI, partial [Gemmatimonadetes bacterium]|nr:thiazole tautomerase TenI [Gemmatimonadota bacterium]
GDLPVVAIGGIEPSRVDEVVGAGAAGVAVLRGVWDVPAPEDAVRDYISALAHASGSVG